MNDLEQAYEEDGVLVVPWMITDPWAGYVPRIGDRTWSRHSSSHVGEIIELLTFDEYAALPDGTLLISIVGDERVKDGIPIDLDTRAGRLSFGVPDRRKAP